MSESAPAAGAPAALPPSGSGIKAGEWDDNANYVDYQRWLAAESAQRFHRVDVSERRFLVVRDAQGKAVPRCPVTVSDAQQHQVTLTTTASGHAILFPHAEGLAGRDLRATARCGGAVVSAAVPLGGPDGVVALDLATARTLPATRTIDVAFILDTTGSMGEEISAVKSTIGKVAASLDHGNVRVRIGMVAYKDRGDEYVTRVYPMTTNLDGFQRAVAGVQADGGGDYPESVNEGVHVALSRLDWGDDAVGKFAFLVGDAPPHLDYRRDFDYAVDMKDAAHRGIQIFTIAASGMNELGQVVWRQIAQYTGASNLFVLRGGAGPQSAGAGDALSSCGGTHTNYASGNLDGLILGKIAQELRAIDRDPMRIAGLGKDEKAKPCEERIGEGATPVASR
jgi:Mg-chelatase subunit ChlD